MKEPIYYKYLKTAIFTFIILTFVLTIINVYLLLGKQFITTPILISTYLPTTIQLIILPLATQLIILSYINKINDIRIFINVIAIVSILSISFEYTTLHKENLSSNLILYTKIHLIIKLFYNIIITYLINTKEVKNWVVKNKNESKNPNKQLFTILILFVIITNFFNWVYSK